MFELLSFATFQLVMRHAPTKFTKETLFGVKPADSSATMGFTRAALMEAEEAAKRMGLDQVREQVPVAIEPEIVWGDGERQSVAHRASQYGGRSEREEDVALFASYLGYAVDPPRTSLWPMWASYAPTVAELASMALDHAIAETG